MFAFVSIVLGKRLLLICVVIVMGYSLLQRGCGRPFLAGARSAVAVVASSRDTVDFSETKKKKFPFYKLSQQ